MIKKGKEKAGDRRVKSRIAFLFLALAMLLLAGCLGGSVRRDLVLSRDFQPRQYERVAVLNLDPRVNFSEYVEAEMLRKGYRVKDWSSVRQLLIQEGLFREGSPDLQNLAKMGTLLDVQGIILCSVLEFSRFRDSFRLSIKMVAPGTGNTIWSAQGEMEGKRGEKTGTILREIVISSLAKLPPLN
jgi:hypothetical protein